MPARAGQPVLLPLAGQEINSRLNYLVYGLWSECLVWLTAGSDGMSATAPRVR